MTMIPSATAPPINAKIEKNIYRFTIMMPVSEIYLALGHSNRLKLEPFFMPIT
jgi:hypothetical protein